MILFGLILTGTLIIESCGQNNSSNNDNPAQINSEQSSSKITNNVDPNSSPESVMNTIFQAAQSGEVGILKFLLPPYDEQKGEIPCDGDCKALCNPGNESMREELRGNYFTLGDFKEYFSKAKIIGNPSITGDEAKVNFVFGPNLERNETMNLQRFFFSFSWLRESSKIPRPLLPRPPSDTATQGLGFGDYGTRVEG